MQTENQRKPSTGGHLESMLVLNMGGFFVFLSLLSTGSTIHPKRNTLISLDAALQTRTFKDLIRPRPRPRDTLGFLNISKYLQDWHKARCRTGKSVGKRASFLCGKKGCKLDHFWVVNLKKKKKKSPRRSYERQRHNNVDVLKVKVNGFQHRRARRGVTFSMQRREYSVKA